MKLVIAHSAPSSGSLCARRPSWPSRSIQTGRRHARRQAAGRRDRVVRRQEPRGLGQAGWKDSRRLAGPRGDLHRRQRQHHDSEAIRRLSAPSRIQRPYMPKARGQGRGNSGVYLTGNHELQVLDSYKLKLHSDDCGAIYKQIIPSVNACKPPLQWQTYDVTFHKAKVEQGKVVKKARVTVVQNGITDHRQRRDLDHAGRNRRCRRPGRSDHAPGPWQRRRVSQYLDQAARLSGLKAIPSSLGGTHPPAASLRALRAGS